MDSPRYLSLFCGYGIEIEYMIVDRTRLAVLPVSDRLISSVSGSVVNDVERGAIAWSNELVMHVLEVKTNGPAAGLAGLPELFLENVRDINARLEAMHGMLMPTGMHPWMDPYKETRLWNHDNREIYDTFNRIFNCQGHGWSNLQSMHINLPFADDREFAQLHDAIRVLLPVLPALAASTPFADGGFTGMMDTRLEVYRHNSKRIPSITGLVIPEAVSSEQEYRTTILEPMYRDIAPHDPDGVLQDEWLNSRGAIARFDRHTIEIRTLDTQETPASDLAIAAMIVSVLKSLIAGQWSEPGRLSSVATGALAEMLLDFIVNADQGVIHNRDFLDIFSFPDRKCSGMELWQYLREVTAFEDNGNPVLAPALDHILSQGPVARRMLRATGKDVKQPRLEETYRCLCRCLAAGEMFRGID
jgi:gamma-glutamyl:cysteine ligase YbdK (ATP-grasp superfamily)